MNYIEFLQERAFSEGYWMALEERLYANTVFEKFGHSATKAVKKARKDAKNLRDTNQGATAYDHVDDFIAKDYPLFDHPDRYYKVRDKSKRDSNLMINTVLKTPDYGCTREEGSQELRVGRSLRKHLEFGGKKNSIDEVINRNAPLKEN